MGSTEAFLTTDRLVLRPFSPGEEELLVGLDGDPEVMRYLTGGRPTPLEVARDEHLPGMLRRHPCTGVFDYWAAEDAVTGEWLGWFEFRPLERDSAAEVELGYRLRRAAWGRGLATEGARALVDKGFAELGVERVVAYTMAVNRGSRRVMEKTGLRYVTTHFEKWPDPIEGAEEGEVEYAVTRAEWHARRTAPAPAPAPAAGAADASA
ncbi:GNAT family N-acetyltransferase [Streptomyces sp. DH12]|uniref:GNAT family N-acetyltransferase n=1 Tax=Streptomyces sp. DH12 TaxID=2857010 RepID=UPI001E3BFA01|nr:GNAT family N-acetyltransferase [Streptomyces sp. DH12]